MKFHEKLNDKLWDWSREKRRNGKTFYRLKPEVAKKLKEIAKAFIDFLEVPQDAVKDIVITGSSASFNYTPQSDLDLHLKIDYDKVHEDCPLVEGYLWALKTQFNQDHDITIYDIPVEVYAESVDGDTVHNGLYSLQQDKWIDEPKPIAPTDNDAAVQAKYEEIKEAADRVEDSEVAGKLLEKIYKMRKSGLNRFGEFGTENLAFKKLRDAGVMDKLRKMEKEQIDKQLSLESYIENKMNESISDINNKLHQFIENSNPDCSLISSVHKALDINEEATVIYKPNLIIKAYKMQQAWLKQFDDDTAPQIMLFVIEDNEIKDTKLVDKKGFYNYVPNSNEFYLDRIRDTEDVLIDYNLEPVQKLVDLWNDSVKWEG